MELYERVSGARMHAAYIRPGGLSQDLPLGRSCVESARSNKRNCSSWAEGGCRSTVKCKQVESPVSLQTPMGRYARLYYFTLE